MPSQCDYQLLCTEQIQHYRWHSNFPGTLKETPSGIKWYFSPHSSFFLSPLSITGSGGTTK